MRSTSRVRVGLGLLVGFISWATAQAAQVPPSEFALIGVRILKATGAGYLTWSVDLPKGCDRCRLKMDPFTAGQNSKEIFFHIEVPANADLLEGVHVTVDSSKVRGLVIGRADNDTVFGDKPEPWFKTAGSFQEVSNGVTFNVPLHESAEASSRFALDVTAQWTIIDTPGVMLVVAHADETRRNGAYASGRWPKTEVQAALNLEFAAREAIVALELDRTSPQEGVDAIWLQGFDTNYPTLGPARAHEDWPPHWHMFVIWKSEPKIHMIEHFYLGQEGLLGENVSAMADSNAADMWYPQGVPDVTYARDGKKLYSQTITQDGSFELSTGGGTCLFRPVAGGFQHGVYLNCGKKSSMRRIRVEDDLRRGRIRLFLNSRVAQEYRYDIDTGHLLP